MKFFSILAAALFFILPLSAMAGSVSSKLDGTWIETEQVKGNPRTILHFEGRKLRFENLFDQSATVKYRVTEKNADGFVISFEYRYKVKRGNGRIVERREIPEFLFHVEKFHFRQFFYFFPFEICKFLDTCIFKKTGLSVF